MVTLNILDTFLEVGSYIPGKLLQVSKFYHNNTTIQVHKELVEYTVELVFLLLQNIPFII